jgi:hypothetical protein
LQTLDLLLGFFKMALQPIRQIAVCRLLDHFRQRLCDLMLILSARRERDPGYVRDCFFLAIGSVPSHR